MSYIEGIARESLKTAHGDLVKARRNLLLAVGLLALVHLLTVHPYLKTSREIVSLEASMAANTALVSRLDPEIERLQTARQSAGKRLDDLLDGATEEMIDRFADLRQAVQRAQAGETPEAGLTPGAGVEPSPPMLQMQQMPLNAPPPFQDRLSNVGGSHGFGPELTPVLEAIVAEAPDAYDRLIAFARRNIVEAAYSRVQRDWSDRIRPVYVRALAKTEEGARQVAEDARGLAATEMVKTAAALLEAADELADKRAAVEAMTISHDNSVDAALGSDWWHTVQGKGEFADAVAQSIDQQMRDIVEIAAAPSAAIGKTLALQRDLRTKLATQQQQLERQFADQRKQLATLSGATGVVPVDLASFIGLFPLVLGLVLGLLLLRAGQARREAALAAADLSLAAPEDQEIRVWLARRALGGGGAIGPTLIAVSLALGAILWIALSTLQVANSPTETPLAPLVSGALSALVVLAATLWDAMAIRRLAAELEPLARAI
jgi:hypothetical protein